MILNFYNLTCTLQRATLSTNSMGETVESYAPVAVFAGSIRPQTGKEVRADARKVQISTHRLYCDPMEIKPTDRIVCNGHTYGVIFAHDVMNMGRMMQVDLEVII